MMGANQKHGAKIGNKLAGSFLLLQALNQWHLFLQKDHRQRTLAFW